MIRKGLFKSFKVSVAAAVVAIGISLGSDMPDNNGSLLITSYAQEYYNSSDYHINLDSDGVWRCYNNAGQNDTEYDGVVQNEYGWWKINAGEVDFAYNGVAGNEYGWWKVTDGKVDFTFNGLAQNEYGWWYLNNGKVDFTYNSLAQNECGWWKITEGKVDFGYNGLVQNEQGWWYVTEGKVDFTYNGLAQNQYGWWKIDDGKVNFNANGLIFDEATNAWWYFKDGYIDFSYTELATNDYGEWKINKGCIDYGFTGIASNNKGYWYVSEGKVDDTYTGTYKYDGYTYDVIRGHATRRKLTATRNVIWYDIDGSYIGEDAVTVEVDNNGQMTDDYYYNGYMISKKFNSHGGYLVKICIGSTDGPEYKRDAVLKKGNLNLRDYEGDVSLYYVKVNKL